MGKINRDELQRMLKEDGKSQADCARHFDVSEAAVCKAVKRLRAAEIPESLANLTDKERAFVLNRAEGKNATQSALAAYDCKSIDVAKTLGCRMMKDPDVSQALSDLMAQEGIPQRRRVQRLKHLIECNDLTAVSKGLDMSWKLDGSYAPERHVNLNIDVGVESKKLLAIRAELAEVRAKRAVLEAGQEGSAGA